MALLTNLLGNADSLKQIYSDLQIPTDSTGTPASMSPETYSRFFRVLYNSSYLSHGVSEKSLELLSQTTFSKGLVSGLPADATVAHKFGERTTTDGISGAVIERELHDCGIVYLPGHPYFLCVMTRGSDFEKLERIIGTVSAMVWKSTNAAN
jgi:beta-lactamase class A